MKLGREFVVWDKAAAIRFKKPGTGRIRARFEIPSGRVEEIRAEVIQKGKAEPVMTVSILDEQGQVIAEVDKTLSVKPRVRAQPVSELVR